MHDISTTVSTWRIALAIGVAFTAAALGQDDASDLDKLFRGQVQPLLAEYCLDCHDSGVAEGDVDLGQFSESDAWRRHPELWQRVLRAVRSQEMPPADASLPTAEQREAINQWIRQRLAEQPIEQPLGQVRRLTRIEYENTIRDLFRLARNCFSNSSRVIKTTDYFQPASGRMPRYVFAVSYFFNSQQRHSDLPSVASLPVDPVVEHGFANDQAALSLSPLLVENYFEVAQDLLASQEFADLSDIWQGLTKTPSGDPELWPEVARRRLAAFMPRAFRGRVSESELDRYVALFWKGSKTGQDFEAGMRSAMTAILASPRFLLRREYAPLPRTGKVADSELARNLAIANRLSYFLWASMPDDELFQAAREGRLVDPQQRLKQAKRMLRDPRSRALSTQFGMQWLKLHKVASVAPDQNEYPEYYRNQATIAPVAVSMMIEQLLLFETIQVENRSILDLVDTDIAYLNRQLMDWYQLKPPEVLGYTPPLEDFEDFFRVKLPVGHRGGVITSGATLISTSTTTRTSPVYRGAWILDVVFNSPPPPAPANVPPLEDVSETESIGPLDVRRRLEVHRRDPACASCHDRLDPLGFALENFDAVGRWRSNYGPDQPVDVAAEFHGWAIQGAAQLKLRIRQQRTRFVRAFVEHATKYALGRQLHYTDEQALEEMTHRVLQQDGRFQSVIESIVLSQPFAEVQFAEPSSSVDRPPASDGPASASDATKQADPAKESSHDESNQGQE